MNKKIIITIIFIGIAYLTIFIARYITQVYTTPEKTFQPLSMKEWQSLQLNDTVLQRGKIQFKLRCYKCHGYNGEGGEKGPSLIDDVWIYNNDINTIYRIIYEGSPNKAMYGYSSKLLPDDIKALAVYVNHLTKKTTNH